LAILLKKQLKIRIIFILPYGWLVSSPLEIARPMGPLGAFTPLEVGDIESITNHKNKLLTGQARA